MRKSHQELSWWLFSLLRSPSRLLLGCQGNLQRGGQAVPKRPAASREPIVDEYDWRKLPLRNCVLPSLLDLLIVRREVEHLVVLAADQITVACVHIRERVGTGGRTGLDVM